MASPHGSIDELICAIHQRRQSDAARIIAGGIDVDVACHGVAPLLLAIENRNTELAIALLEAGANPNLAANYRPGVAALMPTAGTTGVRRCPSPPPPGWWR